MWQKLNILNYFRSEETKQDIQRQHEILAKKKEQERLPYPVGNHVFPEENWFPMKAIQKNKEIHLQTYRYPHNKNKELKGVVIMFHGYYNHMNTGAHIAAALSEAGFEVVGYDQRGHGKSGGIKGLVQNRETVMSDCKQFISKIEEEYPSSDIFLLGLSWGGQNCFLLSLEEPQRYKGVVLFAPGIYELSEDQKYAKIISKFIGYLIPEVGLVDQKSTKENEGTSRNPVVEEEFYKDPYTYKGRFMPGTANYLLKSSYYCQQSYENYKSPFLLIQGGYDKLVDPIVAEKLMERSPSQDKQCLFYKDAWHNLWAEKEIFDMIPKVVDWLSKRSSVQKTN